MKDDQVDGLEEDRGGFLGLFDVFAHVGRDCWCSRGLCRISDVHPLIQGKLENLNVQAFACTHFTPSRCVQHWGVMREKVFFIIIYDN